MQDPPRPGIEPMFPSAGGFLTTGRPVKSLAPKLVKDKGNPWRASSLPTSRQAVGDPFHTQAPTPSKCSEIPSNRMVLPGYLNCGSHHSEINYRLEFQCVNRLEVCYMQKRNLSPRGSSLLPRLPTGKCRVTGSKKGGGDYSVWLASLSWANKRKQWEKTEQGPVSISLNSAPA